MIHQEFTPKTFVRKIAAQIVSDLRKRREAMDEFDQRMMFIKLIKATRINCRSTYPEGWNQWQ